MTSGHEQGGVHLQLAQHERLGAVEIVVEEGDRAGAAGLEHLLGDREVGDQVREVLSEIDVPKGVLRRVHEPRAIDLRDGRRSRTDDECDRLAQALEDPVERLLGPDRGGGVEGAAEDLVRRAAPERLRSIRAGGIAAGLVPRTISRNAITRFLPLAFAR